MNSHSIDTTAPRKTALHAWHVAQGGKMVPFAGYEMPVQYAAGVLKEHLHTRAAAGLFDVSHMGQAILSADDRSHATVAAALEALIPADVLSLPPGRQRYSQLRGPDGGILDDLMVARLADPAEAGTLRLVVNAACKDADYTHIAAHLPAGVRLRPLAGLSLIALQGPAAEAVVAPLIPQSAGMRFMDAQDGHFGPHPVHLTRSGYTGEDGFEISIADAAALDLWAALAADPRFALGLASRGIMLLTLARGEFVPAARAALAEAHASAAERPVSPREHLFISALSLWLGGRPIAAADMLESSLQMHPHDALAFKFGHAIRFMSGDRNGMLRAAERYGKAFTAGTPLAGYVMGCRAFALEEAGRYGEAASIGRMAIDLAPRDAWGRHAVAHTMEMTGRAEEGAEFLSGAVQSWAHCNNFGGHMFWHLA
eukprot:gene25883-28201_t